MEGATEARDEAEGRLDPAGAAVASVAAPTVASPARSRVERVRVFMGLAFRGEGFGSLDRSGYIPSVAAKARAVQSVR